MKKRLLSVILTLALVVSASATIYGSGGIEAEGLMRKSSPPVEYCETYEG